MIRLDTHVVAWLFTGEVERLSAPAVEAIEGHVPAISPMVQLELTYLFEIGRLTVPGPEIVDDLSRRISLTMSSVPFTAAVEAAASLRWTRDPFDRLIVADALVAGAALITRDDAIRGHVPSAVW